MKKLTLIIIAAIAFTAVSCNISGRSKNQIQTPPVAGNPCPEDKELIISSFTIEPFKKDSGWILYQKGAKAVLKGKNIASAKIKYMPTGTGIRLQYPNGKSLGSMKQSSENTFILGVPEGLMTTSFWVEVKDSKGN